MSKFKRTRDEINPTLTPVESQIIHAADDVVSGNTEQPKKEKLVSVPLSIKDYELLAAISKLEDRSQRKIASRLLGKALQDLAEKNGISL